MSLKHLTFFAVSVCLFASCKKNKSPNVPANPNKLKMYTTSDAFGTAAPDTFLVSYDNDNRLTALSGAYSKYIYAYLNNTVVLDFYVNNQLREHDIYYLNGSPLADSMLIFYSGNTIGALKDTSTVGYVYNGNLLIKRIDYTYYKGVTTPFLWYDYTYDNNGDLIKEVEYNEDGTVNETTTFTYTNYPVNVTIDPAYMPQQSKHLLATETNIDSHGNISDIDTYTYSFDNMNRLTKQTFTTSTGYVGVNTYTYE